MASHLLLLYLLGLFETFFLTNALEPYQTFAEGSCFGIPTTSVPFNRDVINSFQFIAGGSRYHLFRNISPIPNYQQVTEEDFIYDSCLASNSTTSDPEAHFFAFGRYAAKVELRNAPGIYTFTYLPGSNRTGTPLKTQIITLTDNKSFAFVLACWHQANVKSWGLHIAQPEVSERTKRLIIEHARSHGFSEENAIFSKYNTCQWGTGVPALDRIIRQGQRRNQRNFTHFQY